MADKAEIAAVTALTEGLGADEVDVMEIPVVDDVAIAEHGAEALQKAALAELIFVQALQALEVENMGRVLVQMPGIFPALAGAMLKAERDDFLHQGYEERQFGQALEAPGRKRCPHVCGDKFKGFIGRFPAFLQRPVYGDGGKDVAQVAIIALVLIICLLGDEPFHPGKNIGLYLRGKFLEQNGIAAVDNHVQRFVFFLHNLCEDNDSFPQPGCKLTAMS